MAPLTPNKPIVAALDSSPSSTMSSPAFIYPTRLSDPFTAPGEVNASMKHSNKQESSDQSDSDEVIEQLNLFESQSARGALPQHGEPGPVQSRKHDNSDDPFVPLTTEGLSNLLAEQDHSQDYRTHRTQAGRASSTPPRRYVSSSPGTLNQQPDYVLRFNQKLLPAPDLPIYMEILAYIQRWAYWATMIDNHDRRLELIDFATTKMQVVWTEAVKKGLIPQKAPDGQEKMSPAELEQAMEEERGRQLERKKQKRQPSPSKAIVVQAKRNIHTDPPSRKTDYSITAGELVEAQIQWKRVQKRINARHLGVQDLIDRTINRLGRNSLIPNQDWLKKARVTKNNPMGRNLMMYCLWEIFRCNVQLTYLKSLLDMPQNDEQRAITHNTITEEQILRDQLTAIAMELDPESEEYISSDEEEEDDDEEVEDISRPFDHGDRTPINLTNSNMNGAYADTEPISVKKKLDTPFQTPARPSLRGDILTPEDSVPVLALDTKDLELWKKQRAFITDNIRVKANALLQVVGDGLDESVATWNPVAQALQEAGIDQQNINALILEMNEFLAQLQAEDKEIKAKKAAGMIDDIDGFPTRFEIWQTVPPEGLTSSELDNAFPGTSRVDVTWQKLVMSVASHDQLSGRWFVAKEFDCSTSQRARPPPGFGPALKVKLRLKDKQGYDPEDYCTTNVFNADGFKWRFMSTSTIKQRTSMDDVIDRYVRDRKDADRPHPKYHVQATSHRNGTYEVVGHPDSPEGPGVIHGIWDIRKGQEVEDPKMIWFYDGGDREIVEMGYPSYDPVPQGTMEEMLQLVADRKRAALEQQLRSHNIAAATPPSKPKSGKRVKDDSRANSLGRVAGRAEDAPDKTPATKASRSGAARGRGDTQRRGGIGGTASRAPNKKLAGKRKLKEELSDEEIIRPKRKTARTVTSYVDQWDEDGEDD
ncbi:uncharacterized protein HMPREF1541_07887 [Cyphellophora europaea CBS 101466]|uniref:Uncharacterized protein n=1 Tax=Cyphellophora europaea (strain CBS 101466) TaxID=1220924 RepID=W2RKS0_CYPE1|nr:uncharacterized protein HMPREF1541_07887 [Cyphellophora europaea CBS 101466]ETN36900.1 hypothetical protein HMPREF1541_07887 [Cyphellophora europaea CBS 101466]